MAELECDGKATRAINAEIKKLIGEGETRVFVRNPGARHNVGVAVLEPVHLTFDGSVGYYCAGMVDGPTVEIRGSAGWGVAESMMNGTVLVQGGGGHAAAAVMRG